MSHPASAVFSFTRAGWREHVVVVFVAWLVPFLVHLIPFAGPRPLGVYLLPACWTVFAGVYLYGWLAGLLAAAVLPVINFIVTGLPAAQQILLTSVELGVFASLVAWAVDRWPNFRLTAALAWLPAKAAAIAVQWVVPAFDYQRNPVDHLVGSTTNALAGLALLIAINCALVALVPKDRDWDVE